MQKIRLLSLFCGVGGACEGYALAAQKRGFEIEIIGVDIMPQPNYKHEFVQGDAIEYLKQVTSRDFDFIHASPPCQKFSRIAAIQRSKGKSYTNLIPETRKELERIGLPYVIENVPDAPIRCDIALDGTMFGLKTIRRRHFETGNFFILQPFFPTRKGSVKAGDYLTIAGNFGAYSCGSKKRGFKPFKEYKKNSIITGREVMQITWATQTRELAQAIPPAYTQFIFESYLQTHY